MKADSVPHHSAFDMLALVMSGEAESAPEPSRHDAAAIPAVPEPMTARVTLHSVDEHHGGALPH